jgi:predicted dienelactone hydrolase
MPPPANEERSLHAPPSIDPGRRAFVLAAFASPLLASPWRALAATEPPDEHAELPAELAGPAPIDWDWVDTARQRAVPVRLYWPTQRAAPGPVPLVVFSHGIGGSRVGYSYLGRHLAEQGWACLHVQHVGSDRSLWWGNPFGLVGRLKSAARESEAMDRVRDLHFALDRMLDPATQHAQIGRPAERIDAQRIIAAGHSYGANTTMLAVGARVTRQQRALDFQDPRFRGAILMSAPPFYGEQDLAGILAPVKLPTLHVTSTEDVILIPGYHSGVEDRLAVYEAVPDPRKALVVFKRGAHNIFTDRTVAGGYEMNQQVKGATKTLAAAFLQQQFGSDQKALSTWRQAWQEIVDRSMGLVGSEAGTVPAVPLAAST